MNPGVGQPEPHPSKPAAKPLAPPRPTDRAARPVYSGQTAAPQATGKTPEQPPVEAINPRRVRSAPRANRLAPADVHLKTAAGMAAVLFAAGTLIQRLIWSALPIFSWDLAADSLTNYIAANLFHLIICILLPLLLTLRICRLTPGKLLGSGQTNRQTVWQALLTGVVAAICLRAIHNILLYMLTRQGHYLSDGTISAYPRMNSVPALLPVLLLSGLAPAILEELLFRGLIQKGLSRSGHLVFGILGSALLFMAGAHAAMISIVPLGIGILTARIRMIYDDIKPAMVLRAALSLTLIALQFILPRFNSSYVLLNLSGNRGQLWGNIGALFISGIAGLFLWGNLERLSPFGQRPRRVKKRRRQTAANRHPWMVPASRRVPLLYTVPWGYAAALLLYGVGILITC